MWCVKYITTNCLGLSNYFVNCLGLSNCFVLIFYIYLIIFFLPQRLFIVDWLRTGQDKTGYSTIDSALDHRYIDLALLALLADGEGKHHTFFLPSHLRLLSDHVFFFNLFLQVCYFFRQCAGKNVRVCRNGPGQNNNCCHLKLKGVRRSTGTLSASMYRMKKMAKRFCCAPWQWRKCCRKDNFTFLLLKKQIAKHKFKSP